MNSLNNKENSYNKRGVSSSKKDVHKAIKNLDKGALANSFCTLKPDLLSGSPDHLLCLHADGAGTKAALAYAYWRKTEDLSVWQGIAQDAVVMNTDDLLCVGICENIVFSSAIARNKHLIPQPVIAEIINATDQLLKKFSVQFGTRMLLAGGETADLGDIVKTILVDCTAAARVERRKALGIKIEGDEVIVGFASFGQALYEDEYNSGIGSNGLTSARHDTLSRAVGNAYPETFDAHTPAEYTYTGHYNLLDTIAVPEFGDISIGKLLLSPTRTYVPIIKQIFSEIALSKIKGIIHCTGGGQTKVLHFVENVEIIKDHLFSPPPVFKAIAESGKTDLRSMYEIFNMGHRMEIYTDRDSAERMIDISRRFRVEAKIIGHVKTSTNQTSVALTTHEGNKYVYVK